MYSPSLRKLTVLELLQSREKLSGAELAAYLEVSKRTVQRYIAQLQDLGFPIEATHGVGATYRLKPGFRLPPLMLTSEEALAVTLGLRALQIIGLSAFVLPTEAARAKLERVLPVTVREEAREVEEALNLNASHWVTPVDAELLIRLSRAIRQHHVVDLAYSSFHDELTRRQVEPYSLQHHERRWYLVGHCRLRGS